LTREVESLRERDETILIAFASFTEHDGHGTDRLRMNDVVARSNIETYVLLLYTCITYCNI